MFKVRVVHRKRKHLISVIKKRSSLVMYSSMRPLANRTSVQNSSTCQFDDRYSETQTFDEKYWWLCWQLVCISVRICVCRCTSCSNGSRPTTPPTPAFHPPIHSLTLVRRRHVRMHRVLQSRRIAADRECLARRAVGRSVVFLHSASASTVTTFYDFRPSLPLHTRTHTGRETTAHRRSVLGGSKTRRK